MTAADQEIRVFLLDEEGIVRLGVRGLLDAEPDIQVAGEAGSAAAALTRMPAARPDVAVLEMRLPDCDGSRACRKIRARMPEVACLVLTDRSDDQALRDAVTAGCAGYLLKQARGPSLAAAVRTAASGQPALEAHAASALMTWVQDRAKVAEATARLTAREREVLSLLGEGLSSRQIGERMTVTEATTSTPCWPSWACATAPRRPPSPPAWPHGTSSRPHGQPAVPPGMLPAMALPGGCPGPPGVRRVGRDHGKPTAGDDPGQEPPGTTRTGTRVMAVACRARQP